MASKKKRTPESIHDRDRIIVRLPDGMREKLGTLAEANGRSVTAEVVAAIEQHLRGSSRLTLLWEFFERHRESVETFPLVWAAVENLEIFAERTSEFQGGLRELRRRLDREALEAGLPPITAEQVHAITSLLKETGTDKAKFLAVMKKSKIEEIREFDRAIRVIESARQHKEEPPA